MRDVLLPSLADDWARVIAVQLVGMARFAATRPADPLPARVAELSAALDELADNPIVAGRWPAPSEDAADVLRRGERRARGCRVARRRRRRRGAGEGAPDRQSSPRRGPGRDRDADAVLPGAVARCVISWSSGSASSGAAPVAIAELRRITTGHSRGNWFLELDDGSRYVVRVEQGGVFGTAGADEFEFMQAVGRLGFPVAAVRWLEPTGRGRRPAVLRDGLRRGRGGDGSGGPQPGPRAGRRLRAPPRRAAPARLGARVARVRRRGGDPRADRAVGRRLPLDVGAAGPAARGGRGLAAPPRPAAGAGGRRPRRSRPGQLRPRRSPGAGVHGLGVLPPRRPHRGLVVPALDARLAHDAAGGLADAHPRRGRRRGPTRAACATGRRSTSSRAPAPTARA